MDEEVKGLRDDGASTAWLMGTASRIVSRRVTEREVKEARADEGNEPTLPRIRYCCWGGICVEGCSTTNAVLG